MKSAACLIVAIAGLATTAQAQFITFTATLSGAQEVPANTSPATGTATLVLNTVTNAFTIDLQFSGLTAPVTVAHIHRAAAGVNGPVIIGLDGMALSGGRPTWNLIAPGVTSFNSGGPLTAPFNFPAAEVANLIAGNTYFNIHRATSRAAKSAARSSPPPALWPSLASLPWVSPVVGAERAQQPACIVSMHTHLPALLTEGRLSFMHHSHRAIGWPRSRTSR